MAHDRMFGVRIPTFAVMFRITAGKFLCLLFFCGLLVAGCDSNQWFQSEKKLKQKIQGTWKREFLKVNPFEEDWVFTDGTLDILRIKNAITDSIDRGSYEIDAGWTSAHLRIKDLSADSTLLEYNTKWTIVELSDKVLYIAADGSRGGLIQREFYKKE